MTNVTTFIQSGRVVDYLELPYRPDSDRSPATSGGSSGFDVDRGPAKLHAKFNTTQISSIKYEVQDED